MSGTVVASTRRDVGRQRASKTGQQGDGDTYCTAEPLTPSQPCVFIMQEQDEEQSDTRQDVQLPKLSPAGYSRRNKRKQSEPRRLSTSNPLVKEEPVDLPSHLEEDHCGPAMELTSDTDDDDDDDDESRCYETSKVTLVGWGRGGDDGGDDRGDCGVDELIPGMLALQGHFSRASHSSEDSLDLNPTISKTFAQQSMMMRSMYGSGGVSSDDGKSDNEDGSQGTNSPETLMDGEDGSPHHSPDSSGSSRVPRSKKTSRSYKNLSRSRRIVANARERNRVHTISAAFEGLRRAVPSYSHNQKLSKLAILRIACSYILALASLADMDYSPDKQQMSFGECVDMCTRTLQSEGRSKRRKVPVE